MDDFGSIELVIYLVGLAGGLNWLLVSGFDVNLVQQFAGSANAELAYTIVGGVSVAAMADALDVINLRDLTE